MINSKKFFPSLILTIILLTSPQVTHAGEVVKFVSNVVSTVVNVVVAVVAPVVAAAVNIVGNVIGAVINVVIGVVQDVAGAAQLVYGTVFKDQNAIDAANENFVQAAAHYERAVDTFSSMDKLTTLQTGQIRGADPVTCKPSVRIASLGSPVTWTASGGVIGENITFTGTDGLYNSQQKSNINQDVSFSTTYAKPGTKTAKVKWVTSANEGSVNCSGWVAVYDINNPDNPLNPDLTPPGSLLSGSSATGTESGSTTTIATSSESSTQDFGYLVNILGKNPENIDTKCIPIQGTSTTILVNRSMMWKLSSDNSTFYSLEGKIKWEGTNISPTTNSQLEFEKIYTTIGQKNITVTVNATLNGQPYVSTCIASTTVKAGAATVDEI